MNETQSARSLVDRLLSDPRVRGAGAAGAVGLLSALMGRRRRGFGRGALVVGGLGALGKVAWDAWSRSAAQRPLAELGEDDEAERRATTMLHAMVAAALADGHLDDEEASAIEAEMEDLPAAARDLMARAIASPLDPEAVAARVEGEGEAREVYAASALLSGRDDPREAEHLDRLARALGLSADEAHAIEGELHHA